MKVAFFLDNKACIGTAEFPPGETPLVDDTVHLGADGSSLAVVVLQRSWITPNTMKTKAKAETQLHCLVEHLKKV